MIPPQPNHVDEGDGFYVSFNATSDPRYGSPETTALVWGNMEAFYVLKGDHRRGYQALIAQGWEACFAYFWAHSADASPLSEHQRFPTPPRRASEA